MNEFPIDWQTCVALLIVGGAVLALLRRMIASVKPMSETSCRACSHCAKIDTSQIHPVELFQLESKSPG